MLLLQATYPVESFFYPYHLLIALVTSTLFFVIVSSYRHYLIRIRDKSVAMISHPTLERTTEKTTNIKKGVITEKEIEKRTFKTKDKKTGNITEKTEEKMYDKKTGNLTEIERTTGKTETTSQRIMGQADTIALGSLIVSIVVTGILPFLLSPLLDYSANVVYNDTKLRIDITNLGLASAKNIVSSVSAKDVKFSGFESEPFQANHFRANSSMLGKGFFEISTMPPRSETFVWATLNASTANKNDSVMVYLRSDERSGFHDTLVTSIFYLLLGIAYVMLFMYFVYWRVVVGENRFKGWRTLDERPLWEIAVIVVVISVAEILVTAIYYSEYFPFSPPVINLPPV